MSFFDEFNSMSASEFLSRIELTKAKVGRSYICPNCGHGKGGDGIKPRVTPKGQTRWYCFGCDTDFSNFDLAGAVLGMNPEYEKAELAKSLKELYGLDGDKTDFFLQRLQSARGGKKNSGSVKTMANEQATVEPKDYSKLFKFCRGNLAKFLSECGGSYRAITASTFKKYGVERHNDFEFEVDGDKIKLPALLIPVVKGTTVDYGHVTARAISDNVKAFKHLGQDASLYEPLLISVELPNFIVESETDALSIAQVFDGKEFTPGCVATGGASFWRRGVAEIVKRFGDAERKPQFIVAFDNDDKGSLHGQAMASALRSAGFPAEIFFFAGAKKGTVVTNSAGEVVETIGKVDANDLLKSGGDNLLRRHLLDVIEDAGNKLDNQAATMRIMSVQATVSEPIRQSGINSLSLAEYFHTGFFADIERTSRYASRSTGFENLDAAQIFLPGLYVLGAVPGAGKTTFAWQLLSQLADNGENCVFASYEMSLFELATKTMTRELYKAYPDLSRNLNLTSANIRRGAGKGLTQLIQLANDFFSSRVQLRVDELTNTNVSELCKHVRELSEQAQKPCTLCVDYLQIMPPPNAKMSTKEKIDDVMLQLKNFQRDTGATVIVISAFNRAGANDAKLSSFRESSAIEYSADVAWLLQRRDGDAEDADSSNVAEPRPIELKCLKNRFGATYTIPFDYYASRDYFKPCESRRRSGYGH